MEKVDLSKFKNTWYKPGNKLKIVLWFLANRIFINTYFPFPTALKVLVLKIFGAKIELGVVLKPKINIKYPWFLEIGENSWIGENVWIDNLTDVKIGKNVCLSQGSMLLTGNHDYKSVTFDLIVGQIILEEGVWIGAKSIVCPNVICQSHSILSVNSVANQNLEAFMIYQGNPAKAVRSRILAI